MNLLHAFRSCDSRKSHLTRCHSWINLLTHVSLEEEGGKKPPQNHKRIAHLIILDLLHVNACRLYWPHRCCCCCWASWPVVVWRCQRSGWPVRHCAASHGSMSRRTRADCTKTAAAAATETPQKTWFTLSVIHSGGEITGRSRLRCFGTAHRKSRSKAI